LAINGCRIVGLGSYIPEKILTNGDMEKLVDTSHEWIVQRTGICERHIVADDEKTSDLAAKAAARALADSALSPEDIDLVTVATISPETMFPSTACHVQAKLGLKNAGAFDLVAACSGFVYSMVLVGNMVRCGGVRNALIIGAETLSRVVSYKDRTSCILFGDGAGAAVLQATDEDKNGLLFHHLGADGAGGGCMVLTASNHYDGVNDESGKHYMMLQGREIFRFAVQKMADLISEALEKNGLTVDDIKMVVPHQVNIRIIEAAAKRTEMPMEKIYINIDKYGNTSAASVPLAFDEARNKGLIEKGDLVLLISFGGGLTWSSCLIRY